MPWKRIGRVIYVKKDEHWRKKQTCKDVESAKKALKLLYMKAEEKGENV